MPLILRSFVNHVLGYFVNHVTIPNKVPPLTLPFSGYYKLEGVRFYRLSPACGPRSAKLPEGAALRAAGVGGWYPSGGDGRGHLHFADRTTVGQNFASVR